MVLNSSPAKEAQDGAFEHYPEIPAKSREVLKAHGIKHLFPIQQACFYPLYNGQDLIARDLTGSGKTFAFGLPLLEKLRSEKQLRKGKLQAIMLAPTRELAIQITNELTKMKHHPDEFRIVTVYGGSPIEAQTMQLRQGVDLFVGTTGRVLDHISRGNIDFQDVKAIILDEADVMLKLGFKEDVDQILGTCRQACSRPIQIALFSATIPNWVKDVATEHMKDFLVVDLAMNLENKTAKNVRHLAISCPFNERVRMDALSRARKLIFDLVTNLFKL